MRNVEMLLTLFNAGLCAAGILMSLCRLNKMDKSISKDVIAWQYALWIFLLVVSAVSFLKYGEPSTIQIVFGAGIDLYLVMGISAWRHGQPSYSLRERHCQ